MPSLIWIFFARVWMLWQLSFEIRSLLLVWFGL